MSKTLWPAYILHSRPFQENKLLLQLLMPEYGRISAVIRKQRGKQRYALQPFQLFGMTLTGRTDLKTVSQLDELTPALLFSGKILFSSLYLNELICRLWPDNLASDTLFSCYQQTLQALEKVQQQQNSVEPCLREFEFALLAELGLQVDWQLDALGQPLQAEQTYQWYPEQGFMAAESGWRGEILCLIGQQQWQHSAILPVAKQLSRQMLAPLLGTKPLLSRALFTTDTADYEGKQQ